MNPQRYERLREIFFKACDLELEERQAYLKSACADDPTLLQELGALFQADTGSGGLMGDAAITEDMRTRFKEALDAIQPVTWPDQIGKYTILRKISDGGMGTVFEAEQQNPHRKVALKVIRAGAVSEETLKRFELEADVLALLQHSGIAQIFETGTADTGMGIQPYLAMELVYGKPITEYVKTNNLNLENRLKLVASVCEAVHHAHQKGVVHRDLKPANILVDETGQPKILDFGVARITDQDIKTATIHTEVGQLIGTLAYMSPEQAAGDSKKIDIRSDVYSLGVIAFEILSGNMPYEVGRKMVHEAVRVIQEEEPTRLSSVDRDLRGDVDTIVAKALAKDKERRYQSASDLSSDIHRYLNDEPITARPPNALYQMSKFTRRNKVLVGGIAATFMMLILGVAGTSYGLIEAKANEREANEREQEAIEAQGEAEEATAIAKNEAVRANTFTSFVQKMLKNARPEFFAGSDFTVENMLDQAAAELDVDPPGEPEVQAALRNTIAISYLSLGLYDKAEQQALILLDYCKGNFGDNTAETIDAMHALASTYLESSQYEQSEKLFETILAYHESVNGEHSEDAIDTKILLGNVKFAKSDLETALQLQSETVSISTSILGEQHDKTLKAMHSYALTLAAIGQIEKAESLLQKVLEINETTKGELHPHTISILNSMALMYQDVDLMGKAENVAKKAWEASQRALGELHPNSLYSQSLYASILWNKGQRDEAMELKKKALDSLIEVVGEPHTETILAMQHMGTFLKQYGRYEEAEKYILRAYVVSSEHFGELNDITQNAMQYLANLRVSQGKFNEAEQLYSKLLENRLQEYGEKDRLVLIVMNNYGLLLKRMGQPAKAENIMRRTYEMRSEMFGEDDGRTLTSLANLAMILLDLNRLEESQDALETVLEVRQRKFGKEHSSTISVLNNLGSVFLKLENIDKAKSYREKALELRRLHLGNDHPSTIRSINNLGRILADMGNYAEAEPLLIEAFSLRKKIFGAESEHSISSMMALANLWMKEEKHDDAIKMCENAIKLTREYIPENNYLHFTYIGEYGLCLGRAEKYEESEVLLLESYQGLVDFVDENHPETQKAVKRLISLYEILGKTNQAETYRTILTKLEADQDE